MVNTNSKFKIQNLKSRLKTGDTVRVIVGKDRGKQGKVLGVLVKESRIIVEGVGLVKKHVRARRAGEKGQRVAVAAPVAISNVQLVCPSCKKGTRVSIKRTDGMRTRVCKKCSVALAS